MKHLTTLVAVASIATLACTIARADSTFEPRSETVKFADLDMTKVDGAAVLYKRIKYAAERVCRDLEPGPHLALIQPHAACMHEAISKAVAAVDRPVFTAYAAARGMAASEGSIKIVLAR